MGFQSVAECGADRLALGQSLEEVGDLWRTSAVQKMVAELLKVVRQSMTLLEDNVDQQTALTPRQRDIIRNIADGALAEMRDTVVQSFKGWDGTLDRENENPAYDDL